MKKPVVFTDLDGTLLDYSTYSFDEALPALGAIRERGIPLILCSSKTRKEIEYYREKLGNGHPFISENGGGVFIPKHYFKVRTRYRNVRIEAEKSYTIVRLGAKYQALRKAIKEMRSEGFEVRGFGDMTVQEIAERTGLNTGEAMLAKERDFDEPFFFTGSEKETRRLLKKIREKGFHSTRGKFFHMIGDSDKGKATSLLIDLYRKEYGEVISFALGDSQNDIPMLRAVDHPIIVQKPDGTFDPGIRMRGIARSTAVGPSGWNRSVLEVIRSFPP